MIKSQQYMLEGPMMFCVISNDDIEAISFIPLFQSTLLSVIPFESLHSLTRKADEEILIPRL